MSALNTKINELRTLKKSYSDLADAVTNQKETNENILTLLSQFGESVLQEAVTVICNCAEDIAWEEYGVVITYSDGTSQSLPMSENGTCSFSIKIGQEYSVQLPVIGAYIAPTKKIYTASTSSRQVYWSYVVSGVFGLDELGRRYTIEQIEALEDKSIIKYGGFTNEYLENSPRDDGTTGNGFMWCLNQEWIQAVWMQQRNTTFNTSLLPYVEVESEALKLCNGEAYTRCLISEAKRLSLTLPAASSCSERTITINSETKKGFLCSYGQLRRLASNSTSLNKLYTILGLTAPDINSKVIYTSCLYSNSYVVILNRGQFKNTYFSMDAHNSLCCFDLPK